MVEEPFLPLENKPGLNQVEGHNQQAAHDIENNQQDGVNRCPLSADSPQLIPWLPKTGMDIVEASLVWILWILASDFQAAGHRIIGYGLNCSAVIIFFFLAAQVAFGKWQKTRMVWGIFIGVSLIPITIYACLIIGVIFEPKPLEPHFSMTAQMDGDWDRSVALTNQYLYVPSGGTVVGALVIPISPNQSKVGLDFLVLNDTNMVATGVRLIVATSRNLNFSGDLGWNNIGTSPLIGSVSGASGQKASAFHFTYSFDRNESYSTASISMSVEKTNAVNNGWMSILVRSDQGLPSDEWLHFQMLFIPEEQLTAIGYEPGKPFVFKSTPHPNGNPTFDLNGKTIHSATSRLTR